MRGVLSYKNESNEIILIDIEGKDQEELLANGKKEWEKAQNDPDEKKRAAWDSKPTFRF